MSSAAYGFDSRTTKFLVRLSLSAIINEIRLIFNGQNRKVYGKNGQIINNGGVICMIPRHCSLFSIKTNAIR